MLTFLDSFYAEEGGILLAIGMNTEQAAATDDDFYARFGLTDGYSRTLEEVGRLFNVTRERIRQIEAKALRKLRHPSRMKSLGDYRSS